MRQEIVQLQYLTLGSILFLAIVCGLLLLTVWALLDDDGYKERTTEAELPFDDLVKFAASGPLKPDEKVFGVIGSTIKTMSGHYIDLLNPSAEAILLTDIAGALSRICRFGGQCPRFYSVAEHTVACVETARLKSYPLGAIRAIALHDAAEAYIGDVVKPLKMLLPQYAEIEAAIERVIFAKYEIDYERYQSWVKPIDNAMLIAERDWLFGNDGMKWEGEDQVLAVLRKFEGLDPCQAETQLLCTFESLGITEARQ